jgi:hypothetical protein
MAQPSNVLVIHYSCKSFHDRPDDRTLRITSITIKDLAAGQTHSFSIHKVAELRGISPKAITPAYDDLERGMLDECFDFVKSHQGARWVHWNMRDINYRFPAIEHRYKVLGGTPAIIDDSRKCDLSHLLVSRYGVTYIGHPRLENLIRKNKITALNFLTGAQEAEMFGKSDYVRLHQSTLRKVDILANILGRAADGTLRTNAKWREIYGVSPPALGELLKEHWLFVIITFLSGVASIVGLYIALCPGR